MGLKKKQAEVWREIGAAAVLSVFLLTVSFADSLPEAGGLSRSAADALAAKLAALSHPQDLASGPLDSVTITDLEANSYLRFRGHEFLPPGVQNPEIHIMPGNLSGAASVNFDQLSAMPGKESDDITTRMLSYVFRGTQQVTATGTLESRNGEGKFTLTSLKVGSTSLPPAFVMFMLQGYIEKQYKIDISKPFPLPAHVSRIELAQGSATFRRIALSRR
jgi:hypothetical protein